jgi:DNA helicase-2/ATP-dependent DNA helicase PcrA
VLLLTFSRRAGARDGAARRPRTPSGARLRIDAASADPALVRHLPQRRRRACCASTRRTSVSRRRSRSSIAATPRTCSGSFGHGLGFGDTKGRNRFPQKGTCLGIYSRAVNSRMALQDLLLDSYPWCAEHADDLKRLFAAYVAEKQRQAALDFDDLLLYWAQMMGDPMLARHLGARFDHVLVDEYQDTNRLQEAILLGLKPDGRGLTVVGDDAQSIYGFRAAEIENILGFPARFDPPARVVALERNYRSTQPILDASNAVIALAERRHAKTLWTDRASSERPQLVTVEDESAQARWVADRVLEHREAGLTLKAQAVLFRTAHHSAALELELARRNIPFVKFGGLQFLEAAHVKDVLSVLRWAENPRSRLAGFRVAQLVPGIGAASAKRLLDAMDAAPDPAGELQRFVAPPARATSGSSWRRCWLD